MQTAQLDPQAQALLNQMSAMSAQAPTQASPLSPEQELAAARIGYRAVESLGIKVTIMELGAFRTDFNGRSLVAPEQPIDDCAPITGSFLQWLQEMDGKQPGDPDKVAQAMIQVVER